MPSSKDINHFIKTYLSIKLGVFLLWCWSYDTLIASILTCSNFILLIELLTTRRTWSSAVCHIFTLGWHFYEWKLLRSTVEKHYVTIWQRSVFTLSHRSNMYLHRWNKQSCDKCFFSFIQLLCWLFSHYRYRTDRL